MQGEGYCQCGCGQVAPIYPKTYARSGVVKGQRARFVAGHRLRKNERYRIEDRGYETPCWIWQLHVDPGGYGVDGRGGGGRLRKAHRAMYEQIVGPIPDGLDLDHLCRQRSCVNPEHLEPVTRSINVRRGNLSKLDETKVHQIRSLIADGWTGTDIARAYGVSPGLVYHIRGGRAWKDVA
jgi:hypothetical protein